MNMKTKPGHVFRFLFLPAPFVDRSIPLIGGKSSFEILIACIAFIICVACAAPSKNGSGVIGSLLGAGAVTFGLRNNTFYFYFGLTFEKGLYWHKMLAVICYVVILIHGVNEGINGTGVVLASLMMSMGLLYLVSLSNFNTFYFAHVALAGLVMIFAFAHGATVLGVSGLVWIIELTIRYAYSAQRVEATVVPISKSLVKITFPKPERFRYAPGQYCFLMVPSLNKYEYHPFSIASAPLQDDGVVTVYAKIAGDWTQSLHSLAKRVTGPVSISVEGPYGSLGTDIFSPKSAYEVVVLVAGGVGITPFLSVLAEIVASQKGERGCLGLRKVVIIWTVRDSSEAEAVYEHHNLSGLMNSAIGADCGDDNIHTSSLPLTNPSSYRECPSRDPLPDRVGGDDDAVDMEKNLPKIPANNVNSCEYEYHFHLTGCIDDNKLASNPMHSVPIASPDHRMAGNLWKPQRPDLPAIFNQISSHCVQTCYNNVAVFVCGPQPLVRDVRSCCDEYRYPCSSTTASKTPRGTLSLASTEGSYEAIDAHCYVNFDCYEEVFSF